MVPSVLVPMARLPVTDNGKVDRRRLPRPELNSPRPSPVEAPHGVLEREVTAVVREILHSSEVGLDENFFDLGLTSLHLIELHGRLERLAPSLPVTALFQFSTVRSLAAHLGECEGSPLPGGIAERATRQRAAQKRLARGRRP